MFVKKKTLSFFVPSLVWVCLLACKRESKKENRTYCDDKKDDDDALALLRLLARLLVRSFVCLLANAFKRREKKGENR